VRGFGHGGGPQFSFGTPVVNCQDSDCAFADDYLPPRTRDADPRDVVPMLPIKPLRGGCEIARATRRPELPSMPSCPRRAIAAVPNVLAQPVPDVEIYPSTN
jgi:hypothetical protein